MDRSKYEQFVGKCLVIASQAKQLGMSLTYPEAWVDTCTLPEDLFLKLDCGWTREFGQLNFELTALKAALNRLPEDQRTPLTCPESVLKTWRSLYKDLNAYGIVLKILSLIKVE